jgi:ATP-binding protein involved in chromosome partitioning
MMNQRVIGIVENMSHLVTTCPHCGEVHTLHVFGTGGGAEVARTLSTRLGYPVALLAQIPLDPQLRASGDAGVPLVETSPDEPAALALSALADTFIKRGRGLLGKQLGLMPAGR